MIEPHAEGSILLIKAQPSARRNAVLGEQAGALKVAITAPPEDGKANRAIVEFLADWLDLKRSQIELLRGASQRSKQLLIRNLDPEQLQAIIQARRSES